MKKKSKLTIVFLSIFISYSSIIAGAFPAYVSSDEVAIITDIYSILHTNHLYYGYGNGQFAQFIYSAILKVTGLGITELQFLTIFLGTAITVVIVSLFGSVYVRTGGSNTSGYAVIMLLPLVFPGFLIRNWIIGHILFTKFLVFIIFYLSFFAMRETRYTILVIIGSMILPLFNNKIAILFIFPILAPIAAKTWNFFRGGSIFAIATGGIYAISYYYPYISPGEHWVRTHIYAVIADLADLDWAISSSTTIARNKAASSLIGRWGSVELIGVEVSIWFLLVFGIAVVILTNVFAGLGVLFRLKRGDDTYLDKIYLLVAGYFTVLLAGFFILDTPSLIKRIIFLPGILGVVVWCSNPSFPVQLDSSIMIQVLLILLIIGSVLSVPRAVPAGDQTPMVESPLDLYVTVGEQQESSFVETYIRGEKTSESSSLMIKDDCYSATDLTRRSYISIHSLTYLDSGPPSLDYGRIYHSSGGSGIYLKYSANC